VVETEIVNFFTVFALGVIVDVVVVVVAEAVEVRVPVVPVITG
jgi:hypothetical protein